MNGIDWYKSGLYGAAALVSFGSAVLPAAAQTETAAPLQMSPQPFSLAPTAPGDFFSLTSLGKSAGQTLKDAGIYLNLGFQSEIQANIMDGRKRGAAYTGEPFGGVDLDLERILGIPNAAFHIVFDERIGRTVSFMAATNAPLQDSFGPSQRFRLSELSYDQSLFNDHLRLLVGRINPTSDYLISDFSCLFIAATCAQPQSWYFNTAENPYPTSTWGARLTIKPTLPTYLRFGAYEEDPSLLMDNNAGFSWGAQHAVGVFIPVEAGYETSLSTARYPQHFAIGGYTDTSSYIEPSGTFGGPGTTRDGDRSAMWALLQQTVWRPDPGTNRSLELFAQVYVATSGYQEYSKSFVVGGLMRGPFPSRPNDTFGFIGYNYTLNQRATENVNSMIASQGGRGTINPAQFNIQLNYGFRLAPGIFFKPDIEYDINPDQLNNPNPNPKIHDALVVGFQFSINIPESLGMPTWVRSH
ncbi:MAG TPA: carbohydrate porin [Rhodopila sp.]